jgi:hypothetical protein
MSICGTLAYGSFTFPETFNHSVSTRPWYAADETSVKGVECLLTAEFLLYQGMERATEADSNLSFVNYIEKVRSSLLSPRLNLLIRGTGWALSSPGEALNNQPDVILGSSGGVSPVATSVVADLNNGPLPQSFDIEPIGGINAVKCTWKCLFWYNKCASNSAESLIEYNYGTSFSVDKSGRTKMTIAGTYGFPGGNVFANNKQLIPRNQLRIQPIIPLGFELVDQSHSINETGNRVNFRFELQEIASENAYFPYTVTLDGRHQASSYAFGKDATAGIGFSTWANKLDLNITLLPKINPRYAYEVFLWVLMQRTRFFPGAIDGKKNYPVPDGQRLLAAPPKNNAGKLYVKRLTITEGLYANNHTFNVEWFITCNLDQLLHQTGLFKPVRSSGEEPWITNFPQSNQLYNDYAVRRDLNVGHFFETSGNTDNRTSHLYFFENNSVLGKLLFDPCVFTNPPFPGSEYSSSLNPNRTLPVNLFPFVNQSTYPMLPSPEASWLNYEVDFEVVEESKAYQVPINSGDALNQTPLLNKKTTNPSDFSYSNPSAAEGYFVPPTGGNQQGLTPGTQKGAVVVAGGENTYRVIMRGSARRLAYPISCPAIASIEGNTFIRDNGARFTQSRVNTGTVPLYEAEWEVPYIFEGAVTNPHGQIFYNLSASTNARPEFFV